MMMMSVGYEAKKKFKTKTTIHSRYREQYIHQNTNSKPLYSLTSSQSASIDRIPQQHLNNNRKEIIEEVTHTKKKTTSKTTKEENCLSSIPFV